ncbi:MAG: response regulator [Armatimonadota bacterium]
MNGMRILICEDEGLTCLRYRATLQRLGHEVVGVATDGRQVLEIAERTEPDLVLMDIEMPHLDGVELTRRLMAVRPAAVLIISAYGEQQMVRDALSAGAAGYLVKPVTDDQIEPAIHAAYAAFRKKQSSGYCEA